MKNTFKVFGIVFVTAIIVCAMAACDFPIGPTPDKTPVASDYDVYNLTQSVGSVTAVVITPKSGKSPGARTISYAGNGSTTYAKSTTLPTAAGTYAVTFDVAEAAGWNAASGLSAGTLTIGTLTPAADDYEISGLFQTYDNKAKTVTITPKAGKSSGARTIYYEGTGSTTYSNSTTGPSAKGSYAVTFDVAAVTGWKAATGLSAGTLVINDDETPVADDYTFDNLTQTEGSVTAVTITPKSGKSSGERTIYYMGTGNTAYSKSKTLPTAAGTYAVTFDVAKASGWNPATGLSAGNLEIKSKSTQTQTLSVTILGTPKVGEELKADFTKNILGTLKYQWQRNGGGINGSDYVCVFGSDYWNNWWNNYTPEPADAGKKIRVKVRVEDDKGNVKAEAASEPVTILALTSYTVQIEQHGRNLYALARVGDMNWDANSDGFSCQWFSNDPSPVATGSVLTLKSTDMGKTFKAKVTYNNLSPVTSSGLTISSRIPSNDLQGNWNAVDDYEDYRYTYILTFNTNWTFTITGTKTQGETVGEPESLNGTWEESYIYSSGRDSSVVYLYTDEERLVFGTYGVISVNSIVFTDNEGKTLEFTK